MTLDLCPQLQAMASREASSDVTFDKEPVELMAHHVAFFDKIGIYDRLLARKRQHNWHNLVILPEIINQLLQDNGWYTLYMPKERLVVNDFQGLRDMEEIALELLTEYADQFWRSQRRHWESGRIEVVTLDEEDPNNVRSYEVSIVATQESLVDEIRDLTRNFKEEQYFHDLKLGVIMAGVHAYQTPVVCHAGLSGYSATGCPG